MSVITKVPEANIFEEICKEFSSFKESPDDEASSVVTDYQDYDPSRHNPVFYGKMHYKIPVDADLLKDVNVAVTHPSVIGYAFTDKPPKSPPPPPPPVPEKDQCTPSEYLEIYVFPTLLPVLEAMLKQAKQEKCFERKRTKFNALDYLTEQLYNCNPNKLDRQKEKLEDIGFVQEWLKHQLQSATYRPFADSIDQDQIAQNMQSDLVSTLSDIRRYYSPKHDFEIALYSPRPPLPLSLIWTEEEAALKIQSFWRGYLVRREPEVQELRKWQAEWREELHGNIQRQVSDFWEKKMPEQDDEVVPETEVVPEPSSDEKITSD